MKELMKVACLFFLGQVIADVAPVFVKLVFVDGMPLSAINFYVENEMSWLNKIVATILASAIYYYYAGKSMANE